MTRARAVLAAVVGWTSLALHAQTPAPPQFKSGVDTVVVDVIVRDGGRPVTGLRAEDFVVTDNGVRQRVSSVDAASVPIDLTMVVDVSGNPRGPWQDPPDSAAVMAAVDREVREVARSLRAEDRVRILAIDRQVVQLSPFRPAASLPPITRMPFDGLPSLFDTLAAALLHGTEPARRHVVVARSKGLDSLSALDAGTVKAIAERSDALLHISVMETSLDNEEAFSAFQCRFMGLCWPTREFWVPSRRRLIGGLPRHPLLPDGQLIAEGAQATGGALHQASLLTTPSLTGVFRRTMDEYRNGYVLRFVPEKPAPGWHELTVRVPSNSRYQVRARPGYFIEAPPTPSTPPAAPASTEIRTLDDLIQAFERMEYSRVTSSARAERDPLGHLRAFEARGNPWPAAPRREAALLLDLVEPALFSSKDDARSAAYASLDRFSRLVRDPLAPDVFERYWYFAVLTMLEGTIRPGATEVFVKRARDRFPDEPRFLLSEAIAADQRWTGRVTGGAAGPGDAHTELVRRLYGEALAHRETAAEARVRLAWFLHRLGKDDEALPLLVDDVAAAANDTSIAYLRALFRGHVLTGLQRPAEAEAAFRAAISIHPSSQSARVALMNARLLSGARQEAEALAEEIQKEPRAALDPWWTYWQGQYRFAAQAMTRVREIAR